jgi:hypothetical protein
MRRPGRSLRGALLLLGLLWLVEGEAFASDAQASDTRPAADGVGGVANIGDSIRRVPADLQRIFSYPLDEPADFVKGALGVGLLIALDKPLTRATQDHVEVPLSGFRLHEAPGPFRKVGTGGTDGWLALGVAATYLGGLALDDDRSQKTALAATKSMVYAVLISQVLLKSVTGRRRPLDSLSQGSATDGGVYTGNPLDFGHAHLVTNSTQEASSFPSFHFTLWFAVAKVYQVAYDNTVVPYSIATVGLASNIQGHHHWVSDMTAGALIGTLIGSVTASNSFEDSKRLRLSAAWAGGGPVVLATRPF